MFWHAVTFLTIFPTPRLDWQPGDLGRSAPYFPLVGALVGGLVALVYVGSSPLFPPLVSGVLTVALWAMLSGGLHLDGLADCGDGLLASVPPARRLEIMKDPRLGSFGGIVLLLHLCLKMALVASLAGNAWPLLLGATNGRWLAVVTARATTPASAGLAAEFSQPFPLFTLGLAALLPVGFSIALGIKGMAALVAVHLLAGLVWRFAQRRLGGVNGDVYGGLIELAESLTLLVFVANWTL